MPLLADAGIAHTQAIIENGLRFLPTSPDYIADYFEAQHITGLRSSPACCPVANYLKRLGSGADYLSVSDDDVTCPTPWQDPFETPATVALPPAVQSFINRFDHGEFESLLP